MTSAITWYQGESRDWLVEIRDPEGAPSGASFTGAELRVLLSGDASQTIAGAAVSIDGQPGFSFPLEPATLGGLPLGQHVVLLWLSSSRGETCEARLQIDIRRGR